MTLNNKDILARLRNGESIEDIAAELTSALNEAQEAYEAENAKATAKAALTAAAENLTNALLDYLYVIDPTIDEMLTEEDEKELTNLLVSEADDLAKGIHLIKTLVPAVQSKPKVEVANTKSDFEDILASFLKQNGLS